MTAWAAALPAPERRDEGGEERVRAFVLRFLSTCGARFRWLEDGLLAVRLPAEVAASLGTPSEDVWAFDAGHAAPGVQVIAEGSPVLDAMVQRARARGAAADLICISPSLYARLHDLCGAGPGTAAQGVPVPDPAGLFDGVRVRAVGRRVLFQDVLVFHFKVAYITDERIEALCAVAADPVAEAATLIEEEDLARALAGACSRPVSSLRTAAHRPGSGGTAPAGYAVRRMFRIACDVLDRAVQAGAAAVAQEAEERRRSELALLEAYYRDAAAELADPLRRTLRNLVALKARAALFSGAAAVRTAEEEAAEEALRLERDLRRALDRLERDRRRRIAELAERYRLRTEWELVSVARLAVPRVEWRVRVAGRVRREVAVLYDVLRNAFLGSECDGCGRLAAPLAPGNDGSLLCRACSQAGPSSG